MSDFMACYVAQSHIVMKIFNKEKCSMNREVKPKTKIKTGVTVKGFLILIPALLLWPPVTLVEAVP